MFKNYRRDRCYIIAEIGGNFLSLEHGIRLVDLAAAAGVDAVKLQTFRADTVASRRAIFDMENTGIVSQHELFEKFEISGEIHASLFDYAAAKGLDWFSTPSHESDLTLLESLHVGCHKVGSDDAVNLPFLRAVAATGKPIILSTGMCTLEEVRESVQTIRAAGCPQLMLLHCTTSYPTHPEHVNLRAMVTLQREFPDLEVGYSDHTIGPTACLSAAALGARILERHFTDDKAGPFPDAILSADPAEMRCIVESVRMIERMLGDGAKVPAASEATTRINNRKSIVLTKMVRAGEILSREHLAIKRPGTGIPPRRLEDVIGREVARPLQPDDVLTWEDLR